MATDRAHGAYIYCRYSTEHQHSIAEQVDACAKVCDQRGLPVLGTYSDAAVSGTKLSRANFDRMMADLRAGLADTVVIYDQSRLMRNVVGWFTTRTELQELGVRIISATQSHVGGDIRKSDVFAMESFQATYDQMHVLISREKSTNKLHFMARNGEHTGGVPALGYKVVTGQDGKKRLAVEPGEAEIVRRIFSEYAAGKSYRLIIEGLNRDGLRTKRGQPFGTNSIHDLLKNRLYIGQKIYGARSYRLDGTRNTHRPEGADVVTTLAPELAIVENKTFEAVQEMMERNRKQNFTRRTFARDYPLKNKVFCGECGSALGVATSHPKKGEAYFYYACLRKRRAHDCTAAPIRCDTLEKLVVAAVRAALNSPTARAEALPQLLAASPATAAAAKISRLENQKQSLARKLDNALEALLDLGGLPELRKKISALKAELEETDRALAAARQEQSGIDALTPDQIEAVFSRLVTAASNDPAAVLSLVSRVDVYNNKILISINLHPHPSGPKGDDKPDIITSVGPPSGVPTLIINTTGLWIISARQ